MSQKPEGRQQILPENRESSTVGDMAVGEVAYTMQWGMWVDLERRCWLNPDYPAGPSPFRTANMRIERRDDGYHVWAPPGATWRPAANPGYVRPAETVDIPVAQIHDLHDTNQHTDP
ncbi:MULTISPECIES: hypothetical protein [Mycolicibacter]|uniref:Uncharacterized protein n=2 Tax=Mycolicibacter TaxID=1073531 RepID=A0ABU5XML4_9MYCO|nr:MULTISPECIES: hypothetical protein [unclassified Mycolicibacter]MEB3023446.1 hypothetical protein [Mycolicibacter sp. MYC098]MEB3033789.1 hypothetical protein [Mycolicibacter sp. MYC340]